MEVTSTIKPPRSEEYTNDRIGCFTIYSKPQVDTYVFLNHLIDSSCGTEDCASMHIDLSLPDDLTVGRGLAVPETRPGNLRVCHVVGWIRAILRCSAIQDSPQRRGGKSIAS